MVGEDLEEASAEEMDSERDLMEASVWEEILLSSAATRRWMWSSRSEARVLSDCGMVSREQGIGGVGREGGGLREIVRGFGEGLGRGGRVFRWRLSAFDGGIGIKAGQYAVKTCSWGLDGLEVEEPMF